MLQIRPLLPDDWQYLRKIRLEALTRHRDLFCPSQDEFAFSEAQWRERLKNLNGCSFGVFDGVRIVGLCGINREGNQTGSSIAYIVGAYLSEAYRGQGLSKKMYQARIDWARQQRDITELRVEHRTSNAPARAAHQHFGFEFVSAQTRQWRDGSHHETEIYRLLLSQACTD